ncbi:MAG: mandelate racemase/muconate lactonizing enzyme family protein [Deltaproteobacteria bacterium]|nr:mandelate racemase/muconate lactonizing enzyme family protein [Deltaproteobacteria bacterium]
MFSSRRRTVLQSALAGAAGLSAFGVLPTTSRFRRAQAALKSMKITRVRFYENPLSRPLFNQSKHIVTVETDAGITGIGEGGTADNVLRLAAFLIGQDANRIEEAWQYMYRGDFYPPGREKVHALGALDMALWDIKGKALDVPVYELLGGLTRDSVECYATGYPQKGTLKAAAAACMKDGYRAFRTAVVGPKDNMAVFNARQAVDETVTHCTELRAGVGSKGDFCIDYHTRLDFPEAVRLSRLLLPLNPLFCEDLVRSENPGVYRELRSQVQVPIAVGEQFGDRWDINELIEGRLIDYSRVTIPNVGGITEMCKLAALCETHYVGLIPHFTGPVSVAALVHVVASFSGTAYMEMAGINQQTFAHLPKHYDFKSGRLFPNARPGLGVELDTTTLKLAGEVTKPPADVHIYRRPDGSLTNW